MEWYVTIRSARNGVGHEEIKRYMLFYLYPSDLHLLVIEGCAGGDLLDFLTIRKKYNEDHVAQIVRQLSDGLQVRRFLGSDTRGTKSYRIQGIFCPSLRMYIPYVHPYIRPSVHPSVCTSVRTNGLQPGPRS